MTSIIWIILLIAALLILIPCIIPNSIDLDEELCSQYGILKYSEVDNLYRFGLDPILLEEDEVREYINMVNLNDKILFQIGTLPNGKYTVLQKFGEGGKYRIMKQIHLDTDPTPIEFNKAEIAMEYCDELAITQYPRSRRLASMRSE